MSAGFDSSLLAAILARRRAREAGGGAQNIANRRDEERARREAIDLDLKSMNLALQEDVDVDSVQVSDHFPQRIANNLRGIQKGRRKQKKQSQALNISNAPQESRERVVQGLRGLEQAQRAQGASPQEALQGLGQLDAQRRGALGAFQTELNQHSARLQLEADKKLAIEGSATNPDLALKLADKFEKRSTSWEEVARQSRLAQSAWDQYKRDGQANPQSYAALNIIFQKILDPGSVVRESEFARTIEFQSILKRLESHKKKFEEGIVGDDLMTDVYDMANAMARASAEGQLRRMEKTAKRARKWNVDPEDVFAGITDPQDILDALPPAGKALKQAQKDLATFEGETDGGP